jgi:hypothetical protein
MAIYIYMDLYTAVCIFCAYYFGWQLVGSTPNLLAASRHIKRRKNIPITVHVLLPDDEQKSARDIQGLLTL